MDQMAMPWDVVWMFHMISELVDGNVDGIRV